MAKSKDRLTMKTIKKLSASPSYQQTVFLLCLGAGIVYNSWPLGYLLDNQTARRGLASDLEIAGHPFYWLFVSGDVLTAILLVAVVILLLLKRVSAARSDTYWLILGGLLMFGLFTGAAALLPSRCAITSVLRCGMGDDRGLSLDALTSSLAALGLFISLVSVSLTAGDHAFRALTRVTRVVLVMWSFSCLFFVYLALSHHDARLSQDALMILSGIAVAIIGLNVADRLTT
ncbi:MAG: hypothetical protein WA843_03305 [Candidatus Saccharimonadales bacterium]